jgi:hypothetical protein
MTKTVVIVGGASLTAAQVYAAIAEAKAYIMSHDGREEPGAEERERRYMPLDCGDGKPDPRIQIAGKDARMVLIDDFEEPQPTEDPKPDPRRSRVTARGGRSDDWKGRR